METTTQTLNAKPTPVSTEDDDECPAALDRYRHRLRIMKDLVLVVQRVTNAGLKRVAVVGDDGWARHVLQEEFAVLSNLGSAAAEIAEELADDLYLKDISPNEELPYGLNLLATNDITSGGLDLLASNARTLAELSRYWEFAGDAENE